MLIPQELQNNTYFKFRKNNLLDLKIKVCKKIIDSGALTMTGVLASAREYYDIIERHNIVELLEIESAGLRDSNKTLH